MVDNSSLIISLYNGAKGGTKSTIEYAKAKKLKLIVINPLLFQVFSHFINKILLFLPIANMLSNTKETFIPNTTAKTHFNYTKTF